MYCWEQQHAFAFQSPEDLFEEKKRFLLVFIYVAQHLGSNMTKVANDVKTKQTKQAKNKQTHEPIPHFLHVNSLV